MKMTMLKAAVASIGLVCGAAMLSAPALAADAPLQVTLSDVTQAKPDKIENLAIKDQAGHDVGTVKHVTLGANGSPTSVVADVSGKQVTLDAKDLTFDTQKNVLVVDMSREEVQRMASSG